MIRKFFNKLRDTISVKGKYNLLFGVNNWEIIDYQYDREWDFQNSDYYNDIYHITKSYKIKIRNQHNTPNGHLSDDKIKKLGSELLIYDWQLLYKHNLNLFNNMEKYIDVNELKYQIRRKQNEYGESLRMRFGSNPYDNSSQIGLNSGFLYEDRGDPLDNISDSEFIYMFIKNID